MAIPRRMNEYRHGFRTLDEAEKVALGTEQLKEACFSNTFYMNRAKRAAERGAKTGEMDYWYDLWLAMHED
jgi:hypothetical protein